MTVRNYIRKCLVCQTCKYENIAIFSLLQLLPIPEGVITDVSVNFIEGLPKSNEKKVIMIMMDRLSKYAHFIALSHPYSASTIAQVFVDNVYKLHGNPQTIISDRDAVFTSKFWHELFRLQRVDMHLSISYHPRTDGQIEVVNRCLESYLMCMTLERPHN